MKRILKYFIIYYIVGLVIFNSVILTRNFSPKSYLEVGPALTLLLMSNPELYAWNVVWPLYLGATWYAGGLEID